MAAQQDEIDMVVVDVALGDGSGLDLLKSIRCTHPSIPVIVITGYPSADLAGDALGRVRTPTLFIVGGHDLTVLELNRASIERMSAPTRLEVIPGAGHLFERPGALEQVSVLARDWFRDHLGASALSAHGA